MPSSTVLLNRYGFHVLNKRRMAHTRELAVNERGVLVRVLTAAAFPGAEQLLAQIPSITVQGGLPTLLDLKVRPSAEPASVPDGPIPLRTFIEGRSGDLEGEVIVWVKDGYVSGLELAWYTDDAPVTFPSPEQLRVE